jgi:hypothetical protein
MHEFIFRTFFSFADKYVKKDRVGRRHTNHPVPNVKECVPQNSASQSHFFPLLFPNMIHDSCNSYSDSDPQEDIKRALAAINQGSSVSWDGVGHLCSTGGRSHGSGCNSVDSSCHRLNGILSALNLAYSFMKLDSIESNLQQEERQLCLSSMQ